MFSYKNFIYMYVQDKKDQMIRQGEWHMIGNMSKVSIEKLLPRITNDFEKMTTF